MIGISEKAKEQIVAAVANIFTNIAAPIRSDDVDTIFSYLDISNQTFFEKNRFNKIVYNHGETKLCLYPIEYSNIVVKIPIQSEEYSPYGDDEYDFCQFEEEFFEKANDCRLSSLFAETEYIGDAHGFSVYVQEKVDEVFYDKKEHYYDNNKELLDRYNNREEKYEWMSYRAWMSRVIEDEIEDEVSAEIEGNFYDDLDALFIKDVIKAYGIDVFHSLVSFLTKFNIDDLHNKNVGYIKGRPVLFDYSGVNANYSKGD